MKRGIQLKSSRLALLRAVGGSVADFAKAGATSAADFVGINVSRIAVILLGVVSLSVAITAFSSNNTSALTYQQEETVQFTLNPTLSVSLSGSLTIDELAPSDSSDSNAITVGVSTNSVGGYTLAATVGTATTGETNNNTDLNNVDDDGNTHKFSSLATDAAVSSLANMTAGYWGYSYSTDGSTWISDTSGTLGYSGLPLDNDDSGATGKTLIDSDDETSESIQFKVGASALASQTAGDYTNTINFYAIAKADPAKSMQYIETWESELANVGDTAQAIDDRDGKTYYVARLDDGNIWMTQNLDLCIGCDDTAALDSTNTDLNKSGSGAYVTDYTTSNGIITWTPTDTTLTGTPATITNFASGDPEDSVSGWTNSTTVPQMAEGSTEYVVQGTAYADRETCVAANSEEACDQSHVGNYYNFTAAIASSASDSISTEYEVAANSVCPKGWKLPEGPDGTNGSEFNTMLSAAGIADGTDVGESSTDVGYQSGGFSKMESSPYYFARSGYVVGTTLYYFTGSGFYWSSSVVSSSYAFSLGYNSSELYPADQDDRSNGWSLRCVAR